MVALEFSPISCAAHTVRLFCLAAVRIKTLSNLSPGHPCAPNPGVLTFIRAVANGPEISAVAFPGLAVFRAAEREANVLPAVFAGKDWLKLSSYSGVEAGQAPPSSVPVLGVIGTVHAAAETGNEPLPKVLYDRQSAAYALSISIRSLDYLIATKKLAFRRIGRKVLIPRGELLRFASKDHFEPIAP